MTIEPLGNRVFVRVLTPQEKTEFGLILPQIDNEKPKSEGEVLAIGEGEEIKALNLQPGVKVLFGKYAGEDIELEEKPHKILAHDEILAVVRE